MSNSLKLVIGTSLSVIGVIWTIVSVLYLKTDVSWFSDLLWAIASTVFGVIILDNSH